MSTEQTIKIPDLGDVDTVDVVEILTEPGQSVAEGAPLLTLENQKTAMELPAPVNGVIKNILVSLGDKVSAGTDVVIIEAEDAEQPKPENTAEPKPPEPEQQKSASAAPAQTAAQRPAADTSATTS